HRFTDQGRRVHRSYKLNPAERVATPGQLFPVQSFEQFMKQGVPRWSTTAALAAPDKVKALIAIEPTGAPKPEAAAGGKLKGVPHLVVWGDFVAQSALWTRFLPTSQGYADALRKEGGVADWWELPKLGVNGNTHMLMMDTNSDQIAQMIQKWMTDKGLML